MWYLGVSSRDWLYNDNWYFFTILMVTVFFKNYFTFGHTLKTIDLLDIFFSFVRVFRFFSSLLYKRNLKFHKKTTASYIDINWMNCNCCRLFGKLKNTPQIYELWVSFTFLCTKSILAHWFWIRGCHWRLQITFEFSLCLLLIRTFSITQGKTSVQPGERLDTEPAVNLFMNLLTTNADQKHIQGKLNDLLMS